MVRCFIAILVPERVKDEMVSLQKKIANLPLKCKFVERENLHISLSFLGELEEVKIKDVNEKLRTICQKIPKFKIITDNVKMIPNEHFIRVLAVDIHKNEILEKLQSEIKKQIGGATSPPHLTLCRVKKIMDRTSVINQLKGYLIKENIFDVEFIYLMKSVLKRTGPIYSVIEKFNLCLKY